MVGARLVLAVLAVSGCITTFHGTAVQPNPVAHPTETLRTSERITIITGDMELNTPVSNGCNASTDCNATTYHNEHFPLINQAAFTLVSRDRLRFHVQIDHKWEDYADLKTWDVDLIDDQGHRWVPEAVEHARVRLLTQMWDQEQRTAICNSQGRDAKGDCINTVAFEDDGWRRRVPLGSLSVYRGKADFVFYQRDLFTSRIRWLELRVKRSGEVFEFTWRFDDTVASE